MDAGAILTIDLPGGSISAAVDGPLVRARGVPYASAARFMRPTKVTKWTGALDCTQPATICPQTRPGRLDFVTGEISNGRTLDENCLHLTITAKRDIVASSKKYPVMVFLHGGAFVAGGSDLDCYAPLGLAERDVVGVNISHRLGIFGYMPIPGMADANLGLLDQIAALHWIQDNISFFGGDPNNVTVFGQSAGGDSIYCLLVAEGTEGLFHRGILQSPPMGERAKDRTLVVQKLSELAKKRLEEDTRPRTADEMLSLLVELQIATQQIPGRPLAYFPLWGHFPLPKKEDAAQKISAVAKRIPIMIGYTADEGSAFVRMNPTFQLYMKLPLIGTWINSLLSWHNKMSVFVWGSDRLHKDYIQAGGQSTLYKFNWKPTGSPLGSAHCIELAFILGSWETWKDAAMLGGEASRQDVMTLGPAMQDLWVAFAQGKRFQKTTFAIGPNFRLDTILA
ncbi:hypothetical protein RBB50_001130 [Rhinocladiella similis]